MKTWGKILRVNGNHRAEVATLIQKSKNVMRPRGPLYKDVMKDGDEQPMNQERARSGRVPRAGTSVPVEWRRLPPGIWTCLPTSRLPEPCTVGTLWSLPPIGVTQLVIHLQPPPPLSGVEAGLRIPSF